MSTICKMPWCQYWSIRIWISIRLWGRGVRPKDPGYMPCEVCDEGLRRVVELLMGLPEASELIEYQGRRSTSLHTTCYYGHYASLQFRVNTGAAVNCIEIPGYTSLQSVCFSGHIAIVSSRLAEGCNIGFAKFAYRWTKIQPIGEGLSQQKYSFYPWPSIHSYWP